MPETVAVLNLAEHLEELDDALQQAHHARVAAIEALDRLVFAFDHIDAATDPKLPVTFGFGIMCAARDLAMIMRGEETLLTIDETLADGEDLLALLRAGIDRAERRAA